MAANTEILDYGVTGKVIYAWIRSRSSGQFWNGTAMEPYAGGDYPSYDVAMPELGTSATYIFTCPAALPAGDDYDFLCRLQLGGTPATTDIPISEFSRFWDGTSLLPPGGGGGGVVLNRYERYPTASDLQLYIADAGLTPPADQLDIAILAGIEDLEDRASRHFLAGYQTDNTPEAPYARAYDPPSQMAEGAWATFLDLGDQGDLIRLDSVIWQPASSAPTPLIDGQQFRVGPRNAVARNKPINWLEFTRFHFSPVLQSSWGAIQVTGLWGYGRKIAADVWAAFLANAALFLFSRQFRGANVPFGLKSWTGPQGIRKEYDASMLTARIKEWTDIVNMTASQNGRLSFG